MKNTDTISQGEVEKIFKIKNYRTVPSYVKNGILSELSESPDGESLFSRQQICKITGLKEIPNEPLLTTEEAVKVLGLPDSYKLVMRPYCKRNKIPYYSFSNARGTKTYFLRSELESAAEYKAVWGAEFPDFVARNFFLREILKFFLSPAYIRGLKPNEQAVLEGIFVKSASLQQVASELELTTARVRQILMVSCKRAYYSVKQMNARLKMTDELSAENIQLAAKNKYLISELKISQEREGELQPTFAPIWLDGVSSRLKSLLSTMEVKTLSDVVLLKRSDVEKFRNAGKKTVDELEALLKKNKLSWKPDRIK